jgi:hypothetical protein
MVAAYLLDGASLKAKEVLLQQGDIPVSQVDVAQGD